MADLTLSNQATEKALIESKTNDLRSLMESRKEVWQRLPEESKKKWLDSGKDPVLMLAYDTWKYLDENYFGVRYGDLD